MSGPSTDDGRPAGALDTGLRLLDRLTVVLNVIGTLLIVGLMLLIGADVAGRVFLGAPVAGVPEMVSLSIVAIVFLQVPQALRAGRFTRSDGFPDWLAGAAPRAGRALEVVFDLASAALIGVLLYASWPLFTQAWEKATFVGAVGDFTMPIWPVKGIIVIGCAMLVLQFLARILRTVTGRTP